MVKITDKINQDTPRFVVTYKNEDGHESFNWGMTGQLPILQLLGTIVEVQHYLTAARLDPWNTYEDHPECALIITISDKNIQWYIHKKMPPLSLCGMLEMIKVALIGINAQQQAQQQQKTMIFGPDGAPLNRRFYGN